MWHCSLIATDMNFSRAPVSTVLHSQLEQVKHKQLAGKLPKLQQTASSISVIKEAIDE